ncbi:hypothetical protein B0H63DRAFT_446134 [Podospora didyma]|uniref:Uncharacterized protein n=1 Tax=Podospora didyma TaxID=330526 RepID=A0AAE0U3X9_9PEZI|nr:hypothetical protein B0H63DRAFT_446134 [Podospora didyma]
MHDDAALTTKLAQIVVQKLEDEVIPCCVTGTGALHYYGVPRLVDTVEICVPDDFFGVAKDLFDSNSAFEKGPAGPEPTRQKPLTHTYPSYVHCELKKLFRLMPCSEFNFKSDLAERIVRDKHGVPFPALDTFARSLVDNQQFADLEDLIDGMDLDDAWAEVFLDLDRVDAAYFQARNKAIELAFAGTEHDAALFKLFEAPLLLPKRQLLKQRWHSIVWDKQKRLDHWQSPALWATKYKARSLADLMDAKTLRGDQRELQEFTARDLVDAIDILMGVTPKKVKTLMKENIPWRVKVECAPIIKEEEECNTPTKKGGSPKKKDDSPKKKDATPKKKENMPRKEDSPAKKNDDSPKTGEIKIHNVVNQTTERYLFPL